MRRRFIGALAMFLFLWYPCLAGAYNFDQLLSGSMSFSLRPADCLTALTYRPALYFFVLFTAADLMLMLWILFGKAYLNYRSKTIPVAPGIEIPEPSGEGQFGTAWFLSPAQYRQQWTEYTVDRQDQRIQTLLAAAGEEGKA